MKIQVFYLDEEIEIQLEQITQLCGVDLAKKQYIIQSLYKYFSNEKYALYEESMQGNIRIQGGDVGRKYFSCFRISSRKNLIDAIKISKSSLMFRYITEKFTEFNYQNIMNQIEENLEQLYLKLNSDLQKNMRDIEIGYSRKNLMQIIQSSDIFGVGEEPLESLSNSELLFIYIDLLWELQRKKPEKCMVMIENIDHLLKYALYKKVIDKIRGFCNEFDVWFVFSVSIEGFVVIDEQLIEGINVINHCIFSFPEMEYVMEFIQNRYPCQMKLSPEKVCDEIRMIIQNIGNEEYSIYLKRNVLIKMFQEALSINTPLKSRINNVENAFLTGKDVI